MIYIAKREFYSSFKSFKSIFIILFFSLTSLYSARYFSQNLDLLDQTNSMSAYTSSIKLLVFFVGFIFVFSISHDMINRELEMQTIRLLVSKVKRLDVIIGKFLGVFGFWFVTLTISFTLVSVYAEQWFWIDYLIVISFISYTISFVELISVIIPKPNLTMFLGILLGLILPIVGFASVLNSHILLIPFKYLFPYYYIINSGWYLFIPILISLLYIIISYLIFRKKDL